MTGPAEGMNCISSWSGGKDSCFAFYQALAKGYRVSHLVNFISKKYHRVRFHGTEAKLIQLQAGAIGIPLLQKETKDDDYEPAFKKAVKSLLPNGITGMIFGDIYIQGHREWVERICGELGIKALEPLWGQDPERILREFINAGFEAIVISANANLMDKKWVGQRLDKKFLKYLKDHKIDRCGEQGEYHTLVINGPIFKKKIKIIKSKPILRDGYWFLDTIQYGLRSGRKREAKP